MTTITYDEMIEHLLRALPHLRTRADDAFRIEGQDIHEESAYLFYGVVVTPYLVSLLDRHATKDTRNDIRAVFDYFESFLADPYWTSGGYNYADNLVSIQVLEPLLHPDNASRLNIARTYMGPLLSSSLAEMESN